MDYKELFEKGYEYSQKNDLEKAEEFYIKSLKIRETPETWNNLGNVYRRKGLFGKAIESYKRAIEIDSNYALAYFNLGCALIDMERYGEALMSLEKSKRLGFSDPRLSALIYLCRIKLGESVEGKLKEVPKEVKEILMDILNKTDDF
ncbi:MAG TPA: tetratricopeptide repeat protein [Thermotoga sp.]|nr:tetratricopeptide repeat protein [Thermotoga sp.]